MSSHEGTVQATYRVRTESPEKVKDVEAIAEAIAYEQTVELPPALVPEPIRERVVARTTSIKEVDESYFDVTLAFSARLANVNLSQLLNLIYGNVSIYDGVRLVDLWLPNDVLAHYRGPNFGVEGVRALTGVYNRPLLATALKPNGATPDILAEMAHQFALGGGNIVKDDQNIVDDFTHFKTRVIACAEAVARANDRTGKTCLYFPHVSAPASTLRRQLEFVRDLGLKGVLLCPFIAGMDTVRQVIADTGLVHMAHPAMTGSFTNPRDAGIDHGILLGSLFRLAGADISIFPNQGGRFSFSAQTCQKIAQHLRAPLGKLAPSLPSPGGGMHYENLGEMSATYGEDCVLLVGGGLMGHKPNFVDATRSFIEEIESHFPNASVRPPSQRSDERPPELVERLLKISDDFQWQSRPSSPYKDASDDSFKGVRRIELIGKYGEKTNTDLRYFEIEPGGYSSREHHQHTHVVIGARGQGTLLIGNERMVLNKDDVAWIEPQEVHQLRNETNEPFGFYCIVDHERDRPIRV